MKTYMAKPGEIERKWYVVDAENKPLGRLATEVARLLRGKHRPTFTPHMDMGDHVIVTNAGKVLLTGNKLDQKEHIWHTGYPGGLKRVSYRNLMDRNPEKIIFLAVRGMLPHNRLGRKLLKKLRVYRGPEHQHQAQKPEAWEFEA